MLLFYVYVYAGVLWSYICPLDVTIPRAVSVQHRLIGHYPVFTSLSVFFFFAPNGTSLRSNFTPIPAATVATGPLQRDPRNRVCRQFSPRPRAQRAICNSLFSRERVEFRVPSAKWNLSQSTRANSSRNNTSITVGETFSEILETDRLLLLLNKNHHQVYHQVSVSSSYSYICSVYPSIWRWVSIVNVYTYMYILLAIVLVRHHAMLLSSKRI